MQNSLKKVLFVILSSALMMTTANAKTKSAKTAVETEKKVETKATSATESTTPAAASAESASSAASPSTSANPTDATAADSTLDVDDEGRLKVPTGKYITGGILGSTVGFGIGHAIQDRYHTKGWIFTATEGAGFALMLSGLSQCKDETDSFGYKKTNCDSGSGLITAGFALGLGFHIWEIVDVWTGATPVEVSEPKGVFIIPENGSTKIGYIFNF